MPLYAQLAGQIGQLIKSGDLAPGLMLPTEADVSAHFEVSRITVRQAMARLVADGLVTRRRGSGTYIRVRPVTHHFVRSFEEELLGEHVDLKLVPQSWKKVVAPPKVQEVFGLTPNIKVYQLERLKIVDGAPFGWEMRYLPRETGDLVRKSDLDTKPIYQLLHQTGGPRVSRIVSTVLSVGASRRLARLLRVKEGEPLLLREQTYFSADDKPLMHGVIAFIGDRYRFVFECGPGQLRMDVVPQPSTWT
jgi:GntR family transcriptional regulator